MLSRFIYFISFILLMPSTAIALETDILPVNDEYRLSTGDKIRIQVYNEADLYLETQWS